MNLSTSYSFFLIFIFFCILLCTFSMPIPGASSSLYGSGEEADPSESTFHPVELNGRMSDDLLSAWFEGLSRSYHPHSSLHSRHRRKRINMIREAIIYLRKYGYVNDNTKRNGLKKAIRKFQEMAGVKPTGFLNASTMNKMHQKRCGNSDTRIQPRLVGNKKSKRFTQVSKWTGKVDSQDVLRLKWKLTKYSSKMDPERTRIVVKDAFKIWADQISIPSMRTVKLEFSESVNHEQSDIDIMFATGEHGDKYPFDGAGNSSNILAHTFYPNYQPFDPLNGDIHFDDSENWTLDPYQSSAGSYFPYVLVHEIGHALGLGHSKRQEAVMNPIYKSTPLSKIALDIDDKCALNWNYIGPSNVCLFVWLMVELLPRSKNLTLADLNRGSPLLLAKELQPKLDDTTHASKSEKLKLAKMIISVASNDDVSLGFCESEVAKKQLITIANQSLNLPRKNAVAVGNRVCKLLKRLQFGENKSPDLIDKLQKSPSEIAEVMNENGKSTTGINDEDFG